MCSKVQSEKGRTRQIIGDEKGVSSHNSGGDLSIPARLKRLDKYLAQGLITQEEHDVQRARILAEL